MPRGKEFPPCKKCSVRHVPGPCPIEKYNAETIDTEKVSRALNSLLVLKKNSVIERKYVERDVGVSTLTSAARQTYEDLLALNPAELSKIFEHIEVQESLSRLVKYLLGDDAHTAMGCELVGKLGFGQKPEIKIFGAEQLRQLIQDKIFNDDYRKGLAIEQKIKAITESFAFSPESIRQIVVDIIEWLLFDCEKDEDERWELALSLQKEYQISVEKTAAIFSTDNRKEYLEDLLEQIEYFEEHSKEEGFDEDPPPVLLKNLRKLAGDAAIEEASQRRKAKIQAKSRVYMGDKAPPIAAESATALAQTIIAHLLAGEGSDALEALQRQIEHKSAVISAAEFASAFRACIASYLERGLFEMVIRLSTVFEQNLGPLLADSYLQEKYVIGASKLRARGRNDLVENFITEISKVDQSATELLHKLIK